MKAVSCVCLIALAAGGAYVGGAATVRARQGGAEPSWISVGPGGGGWVMTVAASPHADTSVFLGGDIQGVFYSDNGGGSWTSSNQGLRDFWIETFLFHPADPAVVFAGGTSGVYKSVDRGRSWRWLRSGFPAVNRFSWSAPVGALAMDPADPDVLYAGIGTPRQGIGKQGAIYRSADGGDTWAIVNAPGSLPADALVTSLIVHPSNRTPAPGASATTLYATSQYGFFISRDGGVTWTASNGGLPHTNVARVALSRNHPDVLYLTLRTPLREPWRGGVYRSTDGGRTWSARNRGLQQTPGASDTLTSNYRELAVHPDDPLIAYVGSTDYVTPTLYKTTDGGESWTAVVTKPQASSVPEGWGAELIGHTLECLTMSPLNPDVLYFGTSVAVFRTLDAGRTWRQVYTQANPDGSTQSTGLELTVSRFVTVDFRNPRRVFYGYSDIGLFVSDDGGLTARRRVQGVPRVSRNADALALDTDDPNHLWASFGASESDRSGFVVAESGDSGQSWTLRSAGLPQRPYKNLLLDRSGASARLLVTVQDNGIYASNDGGGGWLSSSQGLAHGDVRDLIADPVVAGRYWAVLGGRGSEGGMLYRSDDRGASWTRVSTAALEAWDVKQIAVAASGPLYLAARSTTVGTQSYRGGVYASQDGGVTWRLALEDPFAEAVVIDPGDPSVIYAGLSDHPYHDDSRGNGLHVSRDGGATWTAATTLPTGRITTITPHLDHSGRVFVGTNGDGVVLVDFNAAASRRLRRP
ncbi:MAG: hypothetical protein HY824_04005 [Acidobacteria bacterium]|nr:hypothetical protein [Acidobacteriota bacterium]